MAFTVATNFGTTGSRLTTGGDSTTGWSGGGAEPDFYYQGANSYSVLIKTSEAGIAYTDGSTHDFTTARLVAHTKVIQTNKDALDSDGVQVWIGNDASNAYSWFVFSATTYPIAGGWQIVVIDPQVSTGPITRNTEGTAPSMTAIDYFAFRSDCSATAKSQNFAADAIEIIENGKGLVGYGNTPTGSFEDFITFDEGTSTNRYGIVQSRGGIMYVNGVLQIGRSTEQTTFVSTNRVLVFPSHIVTTGFCGLDLNIENASTTIDIQNAYLSGRGTLYGSDDRRPDYEVIGTSGTVTLSGSTFNVYRIVTLNSKVTALGCSFLQGGASVAVNAADITGSTFSGGTLVADDSYTDWNVATDPDGYLDDVTFVKGTNAHHAIELGPNTPSTITLRGWTVSGFNASNGQNDSVIYNNSGKSITVNVTGNSGTISYKNGTGASTSIVADQRTITINARTSAGALITDSTDFTLVRESDLTVLLFDEDQVDGSTSYTYPYTSDVACYINVVSSGAYIPVTQEGVTLGNADQTVNVILPADRAFSNP